MPQITFDCPSCKQQIQCDRFYIGGQIACPSCQRIINVPVPPSVVSPGERVIQIKVATLRKAAIIGLCLLFLAGIAATIFELTKPIVLRGNERYSTPRAYRPPVEITVVAKTDSTNLRLAYAATRLFSIGKWIAGSCAWMVVRRTAITRRARATFQRGST
jgi:hypothetical protein